MRDRSLILSFILAGACLLNAQEPFRSGIDLVQIDVVVLDRQRQPMTGLSASDFTVLDKGEVRRIAAFAEVVLPEPPPGGAATWLVEQPVDVATNALARDGRLVVIMFDRSIQVGSQVVQARKIANEAIDALRAGDLAAVVRTSGFAGEGVSQNLTADRVRLRAAVDAPFVGMVSAPEMTSLGLRQSVPELKKSGDCYCGLCTLDAITRVVEAMVTATQRQKMLLFIGSNIVIVDQGPDCGPRVTLARDKAMRTLDRANVTLHAVDPTGLATLAQAASDLAPAPPAFAANLKRQGDLAVLPAYTGGRTVLNTNGIERPVRQIFDETRSYYLLAIERTPAARNEQRRALRVRVNRRGAIVRSRNAYYGRAVMAPEAPTTDRAAAVIRGLLPQSDLPLELALVPTFSMENHVEVRTLLGMEGATDPIDVTVGVFDERARPVAAQRQVIEAAAGATSSCGVACELEPRLALKPGRYEVRVGVASRDGASTGSVYAYVDVPDLRDTGLLLSGVLIESSESVATLRRTFTAADAIWASLQVRRAARNAASINMRARVIDAQDRTVAEITDMLDSPRFTVAGLADYRFKLPLAALAPGSYLLTIDASGGRDNDGRNLRFTVRE